MSLLSVSNSFLGWPFIFVGPSLSLCLAWNLKRKKKKLVGHNYHQDSNYWSLWRTTITQIQTAAATCPSIATTCPRVGLCLLLNSCLTATSFQHRSSSSQMTKLRLWSSTPHLSLLTVSITPYLLSTPLSSWYLRDELILRTDDQFLMQSSNVSTDDVGDFSTINGKEGLPTLSNLV